MNTENKLRKEIKKELEKITEANSPELFKRIQNARGYAAIEDEVIRRVIATGMVPAAVIPQMEMEYTMF